MGGPLSAAQLRSFAEEGVLILKSFVDEETLQLWDAQMAEQLEGDPADSATWAGGPANPRLTPALKDLPQMQAVLRQLGAGGWGGGSGIGGVRVKGASGGAGNMRPRADAAMGGSGNMKSRDPGWKAPDMGHIDGYGPGGWSGGFMLAATAHLVDVEEKGGAFIYWPRSHRAVNRFFQRHPERLDGVVPHHERLLERRPGHVASVGGALRRRFQLEHRREGGVRAIHRYLLLPRRLPLARMLI